MRIQWLVDLLHRSHSEHLKHLETMNTISWQRSKPGLGVIRAIFHFPCFFKKNHSSIFQRMSLTHPSSAFLPIFHLSRKGNRSPSHAILSSNNPSFINPNNKDIYGGMSTHGPLLDIVQTEVHRLHFIFEKLPKEIIVWLYKFDHQRNSGCMPY